MSAKAWTAAAKRAVELARSGECRMADVVSEKSVVNMIVALLATGGSNVLDGGGGSNFLAGAAGADGGADTFFVEGRAGVAWDTILNFHPGDAVTLFGFQAGQSTYSWTASDGAPGFQGATLRADLGGPGGANVSVTFARIGLDEAQNRFTLSTGSTGGAGYLSISYG